MSTTEELLQTLIEGGASDIAPRSRIEAYLKNCVDRCGCEGLPAPKSRIDALLYELAEVMADGGSGGSGGSGDSSTSVATETVTVTPTTEAQTILPSAGKYISSVEVEAVPLDRAVKKVIDTSKSASRMFSNNNWTDELIEQALVFDVTENATDVSNMFRGNTKITKVPIFDTSKVIADVNGGFVGCFYECKSLLEAPAIDISRRASGNYLGCVTQMFSGCSALKTVPMYDFSNIDTMRNMFYNCSALESIPAFDFSSIKTADYAFYGCTSLSELPEFDLSNISNVSSMFGGCSALTTIPHFTINPISGSGSLFANCKSLKNAELTVVSEGTKQSVSLSGFVFSGCIALEEVTVHGCSYTLRGWFSGCTSLTKVVELDMRYATHSIYGTGDTFKNCTNLTECWATNIVQSLQVGSGTSYGHLLTVDSLVHLIYECRDTGSTKTLTVGSANLEKLANVYVKTIDITDEMRAEDDLIDEKLPFVVCESTDEGAMLITDYVLLKNWSVV